MWLSVFFIFIILNIKILTHRSPFKTILILFALKFLPLTLFAQGSFIIVGTHPSASLQNTVTGKQILSLFSWNGKLYSGYGDYGSNTGPIDIYSFSSDSQKFTFEWRANTEAIYNFRTVNGMLYAPAIDRKLYTIPGDYSKMDSSGHWADYDLHGTSTHVYDVAYLNDSVMFMAGSKDRAAVIWKSINNGRTWKKNLTDTAISGIKDDFGRFYFAGVLNEKLYVQARDSRGGLHPKSKIYDGKSWVSGPSLFTPSKGSLGWRPENFDGKLVYRSWEPGVATSLRSFDGLNVNWMDSVCVFDCSIYENNFYALVDSNYGTINFRRTSDLVKWENLLVVPSNSRSFAIMNDTLYIGTKDSKIIKFSQPISVLCDVHVTKQNQFMSKDYPNHVVTDSTAQPPRTIKSKE